MKKLIALVLVLPLTLMFGSAAWAAEKSKSKPVAEKSSKKEDKKEKAEHKKEDKEEHHARSDH